MNEAGAWKDRAQAAEERAGKAEESVTDLLAENGVLAGRVESLEQQLTAANDAAEGLRAALKKGAEMVTASADEAVSPELATAKAQIARQQVALQQYETEQQELHGELRRLAEERDAAVRTVDRMSREGAWTPEGVAR